MSYTHKIQSQYEFTQAVNQGYILKQFITAPSTAPDSNTSGTPITTTDIYRSRSWIGSHCLISHIPLVKIVYLLGKNSYFLKNLLHACPLVFDLPSLFQSILLIILNSSVIEIVFGITKRKRNETVIFNFTIMNWMLRNGF